jgi:hypothetical protein
MTAPLARNIANAVLFQLAWLVCVQGNSLWAVGITALALLLHWRFLVVAAREWQLLLVAPVLGFAIDTLLINAGVLQLSSNGWLSPPWLVCTWILFATTLLHSLSYLLPRNLLLSALLGFGGGPLAYYAGTRFGAASLGIVVADSPAASTGIALLILAVCWSLVTPLLVVIARRVDPSCQRVTPE